MKNTTKAVLVIIAALTLASFAFALGGGTVRFFSPSYSVEADNFADSPQIIVNGKGNDTAVSLATPEVKRDSRGIVSWFFVVFAMSMAGFWLVVMGMLFLNARKVAYV